MSRARPVNHSKTALRRGGAANAEAERRKTTGQVSLQEQNWLLGQTSASAGNKPGSQQPTDS